MNQPKPGPIAWMAKNSVAANLLMLFLAVGGLIMLPWIRQEVFPRIQLDSVQVRVPYPGASPEEVEEGIVLAVEEAIRGTEGVDEVRATASEGLGLVVAELLTGSDADQALNDIESAVGRITTFPEEAEEPVISLSDNARQVLSVIVAGPVRRVVLDHVADALRDRLLASGDVTQVDISGLPPPELEIAVTQAQLRRYDLSPPEIAEAIRQASLELAAGSIETSASDIRLRVARRADTLERLREVVVIAGAPGVRVTLGMIATLRDTYRDTERAAWLGTDPAVSVDVYRIGPQAPDQVSEAVHEAIDRMRQHLPEALRLHVWNDASDIYQARVSLLIENGILGLLLVLGLLSLTLHPRVAFWVTLGMPVSFLSAFLAMAAWDVSINMISLFAFILVLGIVVDDAIVVGEAIYRKANGTGHDDDRWAIAVVGARSVARPVLFAVITTLIAFVPMLFVPGSTGKFFANVPQVVIPILIASLIESLLILPAHLTHAKLSGSGEQTGRGPLARLGRMQQSVAGGLEHFADRHYRSWLEALLAWRGVTLTIASAILVVTLAVVVSGHLPFHFLPRVSGDIVSCAVTLPQGSSARQTDAVLQQLRASALSLQQEHPDSIRAVLAERGTTTAGRREAAAESTSLAKANQASVAMELVAAKRRGIQPEALAQQWRQSLGEIPGLDRIDFTYTAAVSLAPDMAIELSHPDTTTLERCALQLADTLRSYDGVRDIDDGVERGAPEIAVELLPSARVLGITERDLALQIRGAYYGLEAQELQRDRDVLRLMVRRAEAERHSLADFHELMIQTPAGGEIPLTDAARLRWQRSYSSIEREQGRRVITVTADIDRARTSTDRVMSDLQANGLQELLAAHPRLQWQRSGQQQRRQESMTALISGMAIAVLAMYSLLAIAFNSYLQPVLILLAIPFSLIGAVIGHLLLGYALSIVSMFGLVALAGVVVNDALVLISAINHHRAAGQSAPEAAVTGSVERLRPVLLTSLTTFVGLAPMIFETSVQARFLVPMALSLGFGVLLVTGIVLIIVPAGYLLLPGNRGHRTDDEENGEP